MVVVSVSRWLSLGFFVAIAACAAGQPKPLPPPETARATPAGSEHRPAPPRKSTPKAAVKEDVCKRSVDGVGKSVASAKPFTRASGTCAEAFCDIVETPPQGADACFVATKNISRAERDMKLSRNAPGARAPWKSGVPPKYWDRVSSHVHLAEEEEALLGKNGFVVLDRLGYGSYAVAYHDVFQQELPVYVSIDAIMNAVFQSSQSILEEVEEKRLGPKLVTMLDRMRATLARSKGIYDAETIADLDVYLSVAHRLLHKTDGESESVAATFAQKATEANELAQVKLFGRERMIDFSQYAPRGHYAAGYEHGFDLPRNAAGETKHIELSDYFRAMMWLSRLELNLVSRSSRSSHPGETPDPSETPREARDAIALADLVSRSGSLADVRAFEDTYSVFAGKREDVSIPDLLALASSANLKPRDDAAPAKLKAAIGDKWKRTARTHFMPQGTQELPAITTLFGPRIVPDIAPLTALVHDSVNDRTSLGAADVGYVLGQDRAKTYLASDLKKFPTLEAKLETSREALAADARSRKDVYGTWLRSIVALGEPAEGVVPSFMKTDAFADARLSSALAGYAQLRHTFVLLAGQGYDAYGCEIPDGYVEPAVATYDALLAWVAAARTAAPQRAKYFARVAEILGMLRTIAKAELAGQALSEPQRRWLGMISEYTPTGGYADSGEPPKYTGWYFDLFPDHEKGAERAVDLVADYFTLTNADQVRYLGIEKTALGVFVVDTNGEPRAMVGPVVKPYETTTAITKRFDDAEARKATSRSAPWLGYLASAKPEPTLSATLHVCNQDARVVVEAPSALGEITIELLDHHGDRLAAPVTKRVDADSSTIFAFDMTKEVMEAKNGIEGMHLRVHDLAVSKVGKGRFDIVSGLATYRSTVDGYGDVRPKTLDIALGANRPAAEE